MKTIVPKTLNDKDHQALSQKFRQQTPEEGRRTYRPKCCGNNNKDEDNSQKTLNDKNHQASSQKFRQIKWELELNQSLAEATKLLCLIMTIIIFPGDQSKALIHLDLGDYST